MGNEVISHRDCLNYAPVDVVKGICHRTGEVVAADDPGCGELQILPKCKWCRHYSGADNITLGACHAGENDFFAYADMAATACPWFDSRE